MAGVFYTLRDMCREVHKDSWFFAEPDSDIEVTDREGLNHRFVWGVSALGDGVVTGAIWALGCHYALTGPEDALPFIGRDSVLVRGVNETLANWRVRLQKRWDAWAAAGMAAGIVSQLEAYGLKVAQPAHLPTRGTWTVTSNLTVTFDADDPDGGSTAMRLADQVDGFPQAHTITIALKDLTPGVPVKLSGKAKASVIDAVRFYRNPYFAWVDFATPSGASATGGMLAHAEAADEDGWVDWFVSWIPAAATETLVLTLSTSTAATSYQGAGTGTLDLADVTLKHARVEVVADYEWVADPIAHDTLMADGAGGSDYVARRWSRFWVVIPEGLHGWTTDIPAADQAAIRRILHTFRAAEEVPADVIAVTSGRLWGWPLDNVTPAELNAANFQPAGTAIRFTV